MKKKKIKFCNKFDITHTDYISEYMVPCFIIIPYFGDIYFKFLKTFMKGCLNVLFILFFKVKRTGS